jgi:diguanylate cyclase (GGDEF)-like protein
MDRMASEALRILQPLSALIEKPLSLPGDADVFAVQCPLPLTDRERELVDAAMDVVRESNARYADLEQRFRTLSELSARDALTGLYNRWYVMEKIESEMNRSLRHGSPVAVLMIDIDHFKRVNDTWGHAVGDRVLKSVGQVLRDSCRVYDVPGRYGGEEFCVVLPETKLGSSPAVAERIRSRVESAFVPVDHTSINVTASIGVAGLDEETADAILTASALIDRADRALYVAKHRGRNRVELSC